MSNWLKVKHKEKKYNKLLFLLFFILPTSCSIKHVGIPGLMSVEYSENDHNYRTKVEAWGVYMSTRPVDRGITFGHTKRIYIQPKSSYKEDALVNMLPDLFEENWRAATSKIEVNPGAIALLNKSTGLSIRTNRNSIGLLLGLRSYYLLEINKNFSGIFTININNE